MSASPAAQIVPWLLGGASLAALAGSLDAARRLGAGRTAALTTGIGSAWLAACVTWGPQHLPVAWLNPIREGLTESHLEAVFGFGVQAGALQRQLWAPLLLGPDADLRALVSLGLGWWGCAVAMSIAVLSRVAGSRTGGVAITAAVFASPLGLWMATGETAAPQVAVLGLLGVAPFVVWRDAHAAPWAARIAGGTLVLLTALVATSRAELAVFGVAALVGGGVTRGDRFPRQRSLWAHQVDRLWRWVTRQPMAASLMVVAWAAICERLLPAPVVDMRWLGQATWAVVACLPMQVRTLTLPVLLVAVLPLGVVALAALGSVTALRRPAEHAALPALLFWLYGTYYLAGHGGLWGQHRPVSGWELLRYAMLLTPWVGVLAALGWARVMPRVPGRARALVVIACLLPPWGRAMDLLLPVERGDALAAAWPMRWQPLDQTAQREVRALLARAEAEPTCGILTWGHAWGGLPRPASARWTLGIPQSRTGHLRRTDLPADAPLDAVLDALHAQDLPCLVAWQGMDCALEDSGGCATLSALPPLAVEEVPVRRFVHPAHGRLATGPATVGWRIVPGFVPTGS